MEDRGRKVGREGEKEKINGMREEKKKGRRAKINGGTFSRLALGQALALKQPRSQQR